MIIANDPSKRIYNSETDLIILGSSRAAESIRPSLISENLRSFQKLTILHVILVPYMKTN